MAIDPHLIRSERHTEVGRLIQRDAGILIERWCRRAVEEQPNARRVHHQALLDHLYDFLQALGRSLMETDEAISEVGLPQLMAPPAMTTVMWLSGVMPSNGTLISEPASAVCRV